MAEYFQKWHNGTSRSRSIETFNGLAAIQAQLNNLGREIKKVNEKVYVAQVGCEQCKGPHYTKDFPLKEEAKILEEAYYKQFGGPFQGGGYRAATLGFYQRNNEREFESLPSSTKANPGDQVKSISTTFEVDSNPIRHIRSSQYAVSTGLNRTLMYETRHMTISFPSYLNDFIILDMPKDIKVPLILGRQFLSTARAKIDVYKRKITLRVGEERIVFTSVKPASSLIKRVYMLSLREIIEIDLEARWYRIFTNMSQKRHKNEAKPEQTESHEFRRVEQKTKAKGQKGLKRNST
ncbi:DNA-directed DNA polymerase [Tanacetum coccineum]|uniref:DNA-directed DNA polymerase n=1 Tax=Tanacetum coccineum TaxID=301880 RepID=A0ABQ5I0H2_9ASTR